MVLTVQEQDGSTDVNEAGAAAENTDADAAADTADDGFEDGTEGGAQ